MVLYSGITHSPCMECSVALVQCGIKEVYYITQYRDPAPIEYLKSKGITVAWDIVEDFLMKNAKNFNEKHCDAKNFHNCIQATEEIAKQ